MLGQGKGFVVNTQAPPSPGTSPQTSGQLWLHPSPRWPWPCHSVFEECFLPFFSSSWPFPHPLSSTSPAPTPKAFHIYILLATSSGWESQRHPETCKSANKQWIDFPGYADPCHRLRAGWTPPVITQHQFSAHFCCCRSTPAPGESRSDKILSPAWLWPLIL